MLKQILIIVVALVLFNAAFVFLGGLDLLVARKAEEAAPANKIQSDIVDVFRFTLEDEVRKKLGQPIEGYEPGMFITVFPGLVETDFNSVESSVGIYRIKNGRLEHDLDQTKLVHSAAKAISRKGYETLLNNVADRTGINLRSDGTITDIVGIITAQ